ncbi:hypothetical protein HMPREF1554_02020 [Porphyromonas gingivalis F0569]|nr:hypothetical protein HMPREF1554_02020 [Porphyromonas gingivalis F0569]
MSYKTFISYSVLKSARSKRKRTALPLSQGKAVRCSILLYNTQRSYCTVR